MKERPILFSTAMVEGILDKVKRMTRRTKGFDGINLNPGTYEFKKILKLEKGEVGVKKDGLYAWFRVIGTETEVTPILCPYGKPGDILWVRETFVNVPYTCAGKSAFKVAFPDKCSPGVLARLPRKPSIHMPKDAARIWLKIKAIRAEPLNDISEEDAKAEGVLEYEDGTFKNYFKAKGLRECDGVECLTAKASFQSLWCSINGIDSHESNPWIWVVEFDVLSTTGRPADL